MIVLLAFAFLSGIVTILSPCILPVLPVVLAGGLGKGKSRPLGVVIGFVASFVFFTLALASIVQALGVPPDALRIVAVALILLFGLVLLLPSLGRRFEAVFARMASLGSGGSKGSEKPGAARGFWSGIGLGLGLGLVWTPCVGPIMASVISLALSRHVDGGSVLITLAYTLGTSIPLFAVMVGGRALLTRVPWLLRRSGAIQRGFGLVMIAVAAMIGFGLDRRFQAAVLAAFPSYGAGLTAIEGARPVQAALKARSGGVGASASGEFSAAGATAPEGGVLSDYGAAPDFTLEGPWYNTGSSTAGAVSQPSTPGAVPRASAPLTLADLRGKVVLIDFWTYSCVNCIRTLPYLKAWYEAYKDKGFVIVGVHSPEFEFEKLPSNVSSAIRDLGVSWPVAMDDDYSEWNAYGNQYWPAHYFIDAKGRVRYFHFGEGDYATSEKVIRELLAERDGQVASLGTAMAAAPALPIDAGTPETYLGYERGSGLDTAVAPVADQVVAYQPSKTPANGQWSLEGRWTISSQYIEPETGGTLRLGFRAKNVFLVVEPEGEGGSIAVSIDGTRVIAGPDIVTGLVRPTESRLYQLVKLPVAGEHLLTLEVKGRLRLFAFTFG
ncbi:MAG TPA: cytochrome c biogenesis protein DipZ [Rectinemataceae bacterium]|nr:cytochrome c biogenesis protein DipZ [Rectinemataceae bacterium]